MSTPSIETLASWAGTLTFAGFASPSAEPVSTNEGALAVPVEDDATIRRYCEPSNNTEAETPALALLIFVAIDDSVSVASHVIVPVSAPEVIASVPAPAMPAVLLA